MRYGANPRKIFSKHSDRRSGAVGAEGVAAMFAEMGLPLRAGEADGLLGGRAALRLWHISYGTVVTASSAAARRCGTRTLGWLRPLLH